MKDLIAERIKLGDEQAFELFFRKYYVRLCGFANKYLHDPDEARNIVQEAFTRVWEGRKDVNPDESLKSYIFKITQNLSLNKLSRSKIESKYIEVYKQVYIDYREKSPYESLLAKDLENNINSAIEKLPVRCRKIFELSRIEGLKYSEIADLLHISVKTVEAQMSKALQTFRVELKDYLPIIIIELLLREL